MKKVFFLGPEESYSHNISQQVLDTSKYDFVPLQTFSEIMEHIEMVESSIGVLPIENSITSDIHENIDSLFIHDVTILFEAFLQINLYLCGLKNSSNKQIKEVYSHERALAQCSEYITKHHLIIHTSQSTSQGKDIVVGKNDPSIGVIGGKGLVQNGSLKILEENIGNNRYNMTRFVFVAKHYNEIISRKKNKATVIFKVSHIPGSLAKILNEIAQKNLNVTKIESRPIPGTKWEYQFWIDIENTNNILHPATLAAIFKQRTLSYKILGIYPNGQIFES